MKKLKALDISGLSNLADIFEKCYKNFKSTIICKEHRPKFGDKEIFVQIKWLEDHKAEIFWHISSIEKKKELDILPCNNSIETSKCDDNCITGINSIKMSNGDERAKCIYRATRVCWINKIIEMYNNKDKRVLFWEKVQNKGKTRIYLRYIEEENDYVVVFEKKSEKRVVFVTGYPVFFINAKKQFDKDYMKFNEKKDK